MEVVLDALKKVSDPYLTCLFFSQATSLISRGMETYINIIEDEM